MNNNNTVPPEREAQLQIRKGQLQLREAQLYDGGGQLYGDAAQLQVLLTIVSNT